MFLFRFSIETTVPRKRAVFFLQRFGRSTIVIDRTRACNEKVAPILLKRDLRAATIATSNETRIMDHESPEARTFRRGDEVATRLDLLLETKHVVVSKRTPRVGRDPGNAPETSNLVRTSNTFVAYFQLLKGFLTLVAKSTP